MVDSEWQRVGLGSLLQTRTIEYARTHGVRGFTADVLSDNAAMLAVLRRSGCRITSRTIDDVIELQRLFEEPMVDPRIAGRRLPTALKDAERASSARTTRRRP